MDGLCSLRFAGATLAQQKNGRARFTQPPLWDTADAATVGYDHVPSIEHEDSLMSGTEGLKKAIAFVKDVVITDPAGEAYRA